MKVFLFIMAILLPLLPASVLAQANYHAGYVLKTNGDTLKGYINYREWEASPRSVEFKKSLNDKKALEFTPDQLKEFQITGFETYRPYIGEISIDKTRFPDLPSMLDTSKKQDTIFLRQIVTGKYLTLYYNADNTKVRFFVAEANAIPVELIYHQYYGDQNAISVSPLYKGQLNYYVNKFRPSDTRIADMINDLAFDLDNLKLFINTINGEKTIKETINSRFYIGVALNVTSTHAFNGTGYSDTKTSNTIAPKIDIGIDAFNNPQVQRLIFRADLSFSYITPRFYYPETVYVNPNNEVYQFDQYSATITPQIILNVFNEDQLKVYVDIGIGINFSFYTNNKLTIQNEDTNATNPINEPYKLEPIWSNFPAQVGVVLNKRLELYVNYTTFADYTRYDNFYVANRSINAGFRLLLHK